MANDAFALSPMSASASLPSEADYEAISEAFMETSRGRWFLKEYARRNRQADTAMVLEAVARIETTLASQKQQARAVDLDETLRAVRGIVEHTLSVTMAAIGEFRQDDSFAPSRKSIRIIREVAWRLREVGYDGRICDILEMQADNIESNLQPDLTTHLQSAIGKAFDQAMVQIDDIAAGDSPDRRPRSPSRAMPENVVSLSTAKPAAEAVGGRGEPPRASDADATASEAEATSRFEMIEDAIRAGFAEPETTHVEIGEQDAGGALGEIDLGSVPGDVPDDMSNMQARLADAYPSDLALPLDEAAGPSTGAAHAVGIARASASTTHPPTVADAVAELDPESFDLPPELAELPDAAQGDADMVADLAADLAAEATAPAGDGLSLGASLIARGMVNTTRNDPMSALRRMSQAERIAFFS